jgi:hypothetical protein
MLITTELNNVVVNVLQAILILKLEPGNSTGKPKYIP